MKGGWLRPATHAGTLGFVLLTPVLGKWGMAGVASAAFLLNLFVLPRTAFGRSLAREGEGRWNGLITYPLAVALGFALFTDGIAAYAWTTMAIGDPAATIVGRATDWRLRIPWNRRKSAAGTAAFAIAAAAGCLAFFYAIRVVMGATVWRGTYDLRDGLQVAGICAGAGALLESIRWPEDDDNLPVLLGVGVVLLLVVAMH